MVELNELLKKLEISADECNENNYEFINVFKNPQRLPITQIHLELSHLNIKKECLKSEKTHNIESYIEEKVEIYPALHKIWISFSPTIYIYNTEDTNNYEHYVKTLLYLTKCNYHQFWCLVLFHSDIVSSIHSFLKNPLLLKEQVKLYHLYKMVYQRLITPMESEFEFMSKDTLMNYLVGLQLINLPIVITLILLYENTYQEFTNELSRLYFSWEKNYLDKETEEILNHLHLSLEMIGGHVCGFEKDVIIVPLSIEPKPKAVNLEWLHSVVNYLLHTISSLRVLLQNHQNSIGYSYKTGLAFRLSYFYERIYVKLYEFIEVLFFKPAQDEELQIILKDVAKGRMEFLDVFNLFLTNCFNQSINYMYDGVKKEELAETYLKLLDSALEDEYFICDYHQIYDIELQNEMFSTCATLDSTRTNYVLECIKSFSRHKKLNNALHSNRNNLMQLLNKYARHRNVKTKKRNDLSVENIQKVSSTNNNEKIKKPNDEEINNLIQYIIDMFPHLGDDFVLKCLEAYNYKTSDVISAILEYNLPPHILNIPFDQVRIPPEPKPEQPKISYRGKKPDYGDTLQLLNDKNDLQQIKNYILDGISYSNEYDYDIYDDEYDDRIEEETIPVAEYGDDTLKFNPNYEEVESDTSSENENDDDKSKMMVDSNKAISKPFCEDPALLRQKREAKRQAATEKASSSRSVVGKPKGQGQDKDVLKNRLKKTVNKSSRANHNRKSGAQWKRSRGMFF